MIDLMQDDGGAAPAPAPVPAPAPAPVAAVPAIEPAPVATPNEAVTKDTSSSVNLFDETPAEDAAERPEWLPEKFKSAEELSKSYQALEKKLGAHQGAPDEYDLEINEDLKEYAMSSEDPFAQDFARILKDNGVNQKTYNEVSNLYFEKRRAEEESIAIAQDHQFSEDCKAIGEEKVAEIKESIQWAKEILPSDTFEMLKAVGQKDMTVGIMINKFHEAYDSKSYGSIPEMDVNVSSHEEQKVRARAMLADPRNLTDPDYQKMARDFYKKVYDG